MNGSKVVKCNGKVIGEYYIEIDGRWVFEPGTKGGYWDEHILIKVLYELRVLNAAWDLQIMSDPKVSNLGQGLVFDERPSEDDDS